MLQGEKQNGRIKTQLRRIGINPLENVEKIVSVFENESFSQKLHEVAFILVNTIMSMKI